MPRFKWNNETITNSYGFRILNKGGDFARFTANPVMQNSHYNTTKMNLGSWKNWKVDGFELSGETVFDSAREDVKEVEGQVERGFIKACSMGIAISWDDDSWQKAPDGVWELVKWELMEVSICAIPSLSSALALYDKATMELIPEDQVKLSVVNLSVEKIKPNTPNMEKFKLSAAAMVVLVAYGLTNAESESEINASIERLNVALTSEKNKNTLLQKNLDDNLKLQATGLVDAAILEEKLTAGERDTYIELATTNFQLASKLLAAKPGKESLTGKVKLKAGETEIKTIDDFEKLSEEKKLAFKTDHKDAYNALFA